MTELLRTTTLEGIVLACKLRRSHLGLSQLVVDEISGLQNGYCGKLECGDKGLGKITLPLLLGALGLELAVVRNAVPHGEMPDEAKASMKRLKKHFEEMRRRSLLTQKSRKGSPAYRAAARNAAKIRWRKWRELKAFTDERERRAK